LLKPATSGSKQEPFLDYGAFPSTPASATRRQKTARKQGNGIFPLLRSLRRPWLRSLRMSALPLSCSRADMRRSGNIPSPCFPSATAFGSSRRLASSLSPELSGGEAYDDVVTGGVA
jgi:hypothetical protein